MSPVSISCAGLAGLVSVGCKFWSTGVLPVWSNNMCLTCPIRPTHARVCLDIAWNPICKVWLVIYAGKTLANPDKLSWQAMFSNTTALLCVANVTKVGHATNQGDYTYVPQHMKHASRIVITVVK